MDCHTDVKNEEPLLFVTVKTESQDIREIKTETEECEDIDIKNETFLIQDHVPFIKTTSEVEMTQESLDKTSEDCEIQSQSTQMNITNFVSCEFYASHLKEDKHSIYVSDQTGDNSLNNSAQSNPSLFLQTADNGLPFTSEYSVSANLCQYEEKCTHTHKKNITCDICCKPFSKRSKLAKQSRSPTNEKSFNCNICNWSFSYRYRLVKHLRIHSNERPFNCNLCSKSFSQRSNLEIHLRDHNRKKPFTCDICHKEFTCSSYLPKHLRVHTKEKPFKCKICKKPFRQKSHLANHVLRIHNN